MTGPGGVGKTRLAAEVARRVADRFPDGVWFVQLGAVTDAVQVPAEVTTVLGVQRTLASRRLKRSRRCSRRSGC